MAERCICNHSRFLLVPIDTWHSLNMNFALNLDLGEKPLVWDYLMTRTSTTATFVLKRGALFKT